MTHLVFALLLAQDKVVFEGTVLNAITDEPLKKAEVVLDAGSKRYAVTSGSDGKFRFEGIEPGEYHPEVTRVGFVPNDEEPWVKFVPGEQIKDVVIKLTPQGVIAGHVVDEDGDPVPGLSVYAVRTIHVNGRAVVLGTEGSMSDLEGYFVVGELQTGRYYLSAEPTRHGREPAKPGHPGREEEFIRVDDPIPRDVTPGAVLRNVELHIRKSAVFRIRGRVSNPRNDSAPIELWPADGVSPANLPRANLRDGVFELEGIPPGSYVLSMPTYATRRQMAKNTPMFCRVPVTVADHDIDGLTIELTPGSAIEGTIRMDDDGHFAKPQPQTLQLVGNYQTNPSTAKDDGTFSWTNLAPKKYGIDYGPPEGHYVKSVQFNHLPIKMMQIDLTSGTGGTVDIVVAPNAASLVVTVESGKHAQVALWNDSTFETWNTETNGAISFDRLAPGEYEVLAWQKVETQFIDIPEFRARFESRKITLAEGAHESVEVKLFQNRLATWRSRSFSERYQARRQPRGAVCRGTKVCNPKLEPRPRAVHRSIQCRGRIACGTLLRT